jgi:opacity protein-like surface antigen
MKTIFATVSLAALVAATPALGADLKGDATSQGVAPAVKGAAFTGLSLYGFAGGEFANVSAGGLDGIGADGLTGGLGLGYDVACGGALRCGVWIEGGASNVAVTYGGADLLREDYFGAAGARVGVVWGNIMVYGRAGYQLSEWSSDLTTQNISTQWWIVGGGVETRLRDHLSIGIAADYLRLNAADVGGQSVTGDVDGTEALRATLRLIYRPTE